ncbi:hypothetical protein PsAD2_02914 [Pseudovibrio axinellae]|uniref:Uncharacterized protein n=1 Tax=Pseudovibrio axinellae TaxID=989403 RepID=A0A165XKK9_9HYPH|nr:hypothetical protein PsAD2_02914 [Pseudovibrio axinellae]SEP72191.1 hypothetical protein SAMN05421798_101236 [Pseudovibrio axinellae]
MVISRLKMPSLLSWLGFFLKMGITMQGHGSYLGNQGRTAILPVSRSAGVLEARCLTYLDVVESNTQAIDPVL